MKSKIQNSAEKQTHLTQSMVFLNADLICTPKTRMKNAFLWIEGGRIKDLGPMTRLPALDASVRPWDGGEWIISAGLLNAHTHAPLNFLRGRSHGIKHMIENLFFRSESQLDMQLIEPLSYSYLYDGLRSGITLFGDHYYFIEGVGRALEAFGLRGMIGECSADLGGAFPGTDSWQRMKDLISNWPFSQRVRPVVAPHAADTVSALHLKEMANYARKNNFPLHMHLSQTKAERERVFKATNRSPVSFAEQCGAISEKSLLVHLVSADARDLSIIKDLGATVAFCPASQLIYEKLAPLSEFLREQIPTVIATDCGPSNDGCDLFSELKTTAMLAKQLGISDDQLNVEKLWEGVTTSPAKVFGLENELGKLDVGYCADLVFYKKDLLLDPIVDPLHQLIFSGGARSVKHVMVDGNWVLWNGKPVKVDIDECRDRYQSACKEILRRSLPMLDKEVPLI